MGHPFGDGEQSIAAGLGEGAEAGQKARHAGLSERQRLTLDIFQFAQQIACMCINAPWARSPPRSRRRIRR